MTIRAFLGTTAAVGFVGLALVALRPESEPDLALPDTTVEATQPDPSRTGTPTTAPRQRAALPMPNGRQHQQLSPKEVDGVASSAPVGGDDQDYHGTVAIATELIVPCDNGSQPADLEDPQCVARWSVFHVAAGLVDLLDTRWIEPPLLDELSRSRSGAEAEPPSELLVLDSIGRPNQVGPARADIEVIVERTWPSGELDHLLYRVTLVRSSQNTWTIVAIGRS